MGEVSRGRSAAAEKSGSCRSSGFFLVGGLPPYKTQHKTVYIDLLLMISWWIDWRKGIHLKGLRSGWCSVIWIKKIICIETMKIEQSWQIWRTYTWIPCYMVLWEWLRRASYSFRANCSSTGSTGIVCFVDCPWWLYLAPWKEFTDMDVTLGFSTNRFLFRLIAASAVSFYSGIGLFVSVWSMWSTISQYIPTASAINC